MYALPYFSLYIFLSIFFSVYFSLIILYLLVCQGIIQSKSKNIQIQKKFYNIRNKISMKEQKTSESKHASIHEIINQNKKKLKIIEINQLFQAPQLNQFDTSQFQHHSYMISNELFTFFVHQLEKWNKKIRNKEIKTPFFHAQLNRNMFVYSSLKIICLKKPNQIIRYLEELMKWFSKNSYNIPQPSVLMKKYNANEEWEVRKTFRSNTPSQINNYRRRFLFSPDTAKDPSFAENFLTVQKKKQNCFFQPKMAYTQNYKSNQSSENFLHSRTLPNAENNGIFQQIMKNKQSTIIKIKNMEIRKQRQERQIKTTQDEWKKTHQRFGERTCKDFYKGKFLRSKQFLDSSSRIQPRKIQTAGYNNRFSDDKSTLITQIKKQRLNTSLGIRKNFIHEQKQNLAAQLSKQLNLKTQNNEQTRWIDNFITDQDKIDIRNTLARDQGINSGEMRLLSNPFDTNKGKIKKKRK